MTINEPPYCRHGRPECTCLDTQIANAVDQTAASGALTVFHTTISTGSNTGMNGTSGVVHKFSMGPLTGLDAATGGNYSGTTYFPTGDLVFPTAPAVTPTPCALNGHNIEATSIEMRSDDEIWGYCEECLDAIRIPRVTGSLNFEKAGMYIGRAMTLDDEDENGAELLLELTALEDTVEKEIARYQRTQKMIKIARTLAKKQVLKHAPSA